MQSLSIALVLKHIRLLIRDLHLPDSKNINLESIDPPATHKLQFKYSAA